MTDTTPRVEQRPISNEKIIQALHRIHLAEFPHLERSTYVLAAERLTSSTERERRLEQALRQYATGYTD